MKLHCGPCLKEISPWQAFVQGKELGRRPIRVVDQGRELGVQMGAEPIRGLKSVEQLLAGRAPQGARFHLRKIGSD